MTGKSLLTVTLLFQLSVSSLAQQPNPSPPPKTQPASQTQPAPQRQESEDEVVRITTNLVQVDAVVTDRNGKQVTDLAAGEIQILEDGRPQKISNFSFVDSGSKTPAAVAGKPAIADKNALSPPPTRLRPEQVRRTIALVVDDLGLSFNSTYYVRRAVKKFIDEQMQEGDLVAIIRTGAGIGALQQFTSDKRMLYAALERIKWNPIGRGGIGAFAPLTGAQPSVPVATDDGEPPSDAAAELDRLREETFTVGTLGALNYVVTGLRELPGRKSVLLVSDGIQMFDSLSRATNFRTQQALTSLIDLANRASVVIYTLDARGLQTTGLTAEDNTTGMSDEAMRNASTQRASMLFESQSGLINLAEQTGGIAFRNSNDLSGGIKRVLEDQTSYYLIGYRPDESTFDQKTGRRTFHKLELKVTRPGRFLVRMRKGFFGITDDEAKPRIAATPQQQILRALTSPFGAEGVHLRLTSLFGHDAKLGPFMRSLLHVDAGDLTFTDQPDGFHQAEFDVMAITFGDNGSVVNQVNKTYSVRLPDKSYQRMLKEGFVYFVTVFVKKPGAYQLRAALRDHGSERVGSASQFVEVPDLKKNRLTISGIIVTGSETGSEKASGNPDAKSLAVQSAAEHQEERANPSNSAAVRRFRGGGILEYGFVIYNAKADKGLPPSLTTQVRIFRDGQPVFSGNENPYAPAGQADLKRLAHGGAIQLGSKMTPGEYVLQVIVNDTQAKGKHRTATQWIDFEIVK
jgi:VWFA-related protein